MGADAHTMLDRQGHGLAHDAGIGGVEAAGDIGAVDIGHDLGIQTHLPGAEALADIAVQKQAVQGMFLCAGRLVGVRKQGAGERAAACYGMTCAAFLRGAGRASN
ncbi:hypothetical protein D3C72_2185890 [compost metagenome]